MTYRLNADFPDPYGGFIQTAEIPTLSDDLKKIIDDFGASNTHLTKKEVGERKILATQFVTKCKTPGQRNAMVKLWIFSAV